MKRPAWVLLLFFASPALANSLPIVSSFTSESSEVFLGQTIPLYAQASDPDGDLLTFIWTSSAGSITGSGPTASWTAPLLGGQYGVTVTATDTLGASASQSLVLWAVPAKYLFTIPGVGRAARVAVDVRGNIYATLPGQGEVRVFDSAGRPQGTIQTLWKPVGIAVDRGRLYIGDEGFRDVRVFDGNEILLMTLGSGRGEVTRPGAISVNPVSGLVYVSDGEEGLVKVFSPTTGELLFSFGRPADDEAMLMYPGGMAVDVSQGRLIVADFDASSLKVFDLGSGHFNRIFGPYTAPLYVPQVFGTPTPPQPSLSDSVPARFEGLAVGPRGWIFGVETTMSVVEVFDGDGNFLAVLGGEGDGLGRLQTPTDAAIDGQNRLVVADAGNSRIQVYGLAEYFSIHPGVVPPPITPHPTVQPPPEYHSPPQVKERAHPLGRTIGCSCSLAKDRGFDPFLNLLPWIMPGIVLVILRKT